MVGARGRRVKAALVLLALTGCFWRHYARTAAIHVDVLVGVARKGVDLMASGRLTAESMPELTYPLERAQAFARTARSRSRDTPPPSLLAFEQLTVRYRQFLDTLDRLRRDTRGEQARVALGPSLAEVEAAAGAVRSALESEGRRSDA
jgi:hypothetical protein